MSKNIVEVDPAKFPWLDLDRYTFCMGAENAGILYLSGQTASEYDPGSGRVVCKGNLLDQTRVVYEKLAVVLEAAGMGFENVVQTVDYIDATGLPLYRQTGEIRQEYLGNSPVGATGICVERLLRPDAFIEVSMVAMRGDKKPINPGWDRYGELTYVPGVEVDGTVWTSGFVGSEQVEGQAVYPQDTARQVKLAYGTVGEVLAAAGAGPDDVVKTLDYISPQSLLQYPNTAQARREFFGSRFPASTSIPVNRLLRPDGHVEIEAVAVKGGTREEIRVPEWQESYGRLTRSAGVKKGRLLQISGQSSVDHATGATVGGYDIVAQTEQAYGNIARIMEEGGYSMDDILNTIEWVAPNGMMDYRKVGEVRRKYFGGRFPSATGVSMHQILGRPEQLIEVTAVAVV
ncbi:MAG: RidA family protein [Chloroflexi bacterium]|nr:RidA family protein [Chloroflexota bacterium]MDA1270675.1 RidA family protein [Chloroflexota bacterium]